MSHVPSPADAAPRAAYVHVPFCRHRCGYCNFTVVAGRDDLFEDYLRAIEIELHGLGQPQPVDTLFCGGGTPTHLTPELLRRFFSLLAQWFPLDPGGEFSVEANPEDIFQEKVDVLCTSGVNRVSLGVQSLSEHKLKVLQRAHDADDVLRCFELLQERVDSLAVDLIFGAPSESVASWEHDLASTIRLAPNHVSTYGLTYERGTQFYAQRQKSTIVPVHEDVECEMYELAIDQLTGAGFEHYEVSNFARPGARCRHNENYWLGGAFHGIGPGAASYIAGQRQMNHRNTTTYLRRVLSGKSPVTEKESLQAEDRARERLIFGLRRMDGVDRDQFRVSTGFDLVPLMGANLEPLLNEELLYWSGTALRLTRKGLLVSDSIWPYLL